MHKKINNVKVLFFTKYSRKGASSRLRSYQYFPKLEQVGIHVDVSALFNEVYLVKIYKGEKPILQVFLSYLKRFIVLLKVSKYDLVVIEYELFPYFPSFFEKILALVGVKYVVDYDDAIFHNYDKHSNKIIRQFLGNKIDKVMRYSSCVIAGNSYLADRAVEANAKNVKIIPTIVDQKRYKQKDIFTLDKFKIGWIGSPSTFGYLKSIKNILQQFGQDKNIEIHVVGSKEKLSLKNVKEIHYEWNEDTEASTILNFDVGIMPLENTLWANGKCAYKLIQYMASGIPVVTSPVGMNKKIIKNGVNGFLAETQEEWIGAFEALYKNTELQKKMGGEGRKMIDEFYNLEYQSKNMIEIIKKVLKI